MSPTECDLKIVFEYLYGNPQYRGSLNRLAAAYRQSNGVLLRSEIDPPTVDKLNSVAQIEELSDLNLGQDYFLHNDFLKLCAELRGQNFVKVA